MPSSPETVRRATLDDIPFIREMAKEKYPNRDVEQARPWMEWCIQSPDRLVLVGPNSVGVAKFDWHYGFEPRARMDMLGARPVAGAALEALRMVRLMLEWAKAKGAQGTFKLEADTGVDFGPFSKRLGGRAVTVTWYEIPLQRI